MKNVFIAINPSAGQSDHEEVTKYIRGQCQAHSWECDFYSTVGDHTDQENLTNAGKRDYDLFIAAGGDGTVAMVADAAINAEAPLAIVPVGTGNGAARVLNIPLEWKEAVDLLFESSSTYRLDSMYIGGQHFLLHCGVGLSGIALRKTDLKSKHILGRLYYPFAGLRAFFGFQPHRFEVTIDDETHYFKGVEMFVINSASIGDPYLRWSETIRPTDGVLDVFFVRARTFIDFIRLTWNTILGRQRLDPNITYHRVRKSIHVRSEPSLPMQADGEYVTTTPLTIELLPESIEVISPGGSTEMVEVKGND